MFVDSRCDIARNLIREDSHFRRQLSVKSSVKTDTIGTWLSTAVVSKVFTEERKNESDQKVGKDVKLLDRGKLIPAIELS